MDFSLVSLESLVGPANPESGSASSSEAKQQQQQQQQQQKGVGSGFGKQERPGLEEDEWRSSKVAKTVDLSSSATRAMPFSQGTNVNNPLMRSNPLLLSADHVRHQQQHMLCFSSQKPENPFLGKDGAGLAFPFYQRMTPIYSRNAGYGSGSLNTSMHVPYTGIRGPFTPSQWIELEHQALIYKYITSNVPVPSNLLIPLKKSLNPYSLSGSSSAPLPPNSWWASFHLGYADNTDPEPGRCRRTDGKKWRCSRDAVADQKYCERHINRGRHRSRKPVEGQTGHAASVAAAATSKAVTPMTSSVSAAAAISSAVPVGGASNSLATITHHQLKGLQSGAAAGSTNAALVNRMQDLRGLSAMPSSNVNLKSNDSTFNILKQEIVPEGSSHSEFGLVSTDSLLNPSQESSYMDSKNYDTSSFLDFSGQETQDQHPLRHFIDDWPKDNSDQSVIAWPEEMKSDWTNLSMSIPVTSSDFSSSSNSPKQEKLALSPLRLSREFEPMQTNLGVSNDLGEAAARRQTNWVPVSWAGGSNCSMGGPLGEVLTNTSGNVKAYKSPSSLNLLTEGWDGSPQVGSSPTGVLQKSTFCSLSNSSSESSPRADNKKNNIDGGSVYDDVLGSGLATSSVPSL